MTKRIPGWVVYIPHLNAAYPIAYWVRDSVAVTITDDYGTTRTETYKVDDVHLFKNKEKTQMELCHVIDDLISAGGDRTDDVASDIPGSAGDED